MSTDQSTTETVEQDVEVNREKFIVVSPSSLGYGGYYGKGETLTVAKARVKDEGGTLNRYVAYEMPDGATGVYIDDFGSLHWAWAEKADQSAEPVVVAKRGVTENKKS